MSVILITFTGVFATLQEDQISIDTGSQTVTSQSILFTKSNYEVVSETKNNINVTWFPVRVSLIDKEYNITITNLENKERSVDIGAFFKAITGDIDNVVPGSIKLSYLATLTRTVDDYTRSCTTKEIILSKGEANETARDLEECIEVNNPKTITYQDWKSYSANEIRDKNKKEITLQRIEGNGKITLLPNSIIKLNLVFKTGIIKKSDGSYGNDGEFGLLLNGISYHPAFNISFDKRYLVDITTNDAIDTNYTHNVTFGFTGNSSEIGSATWFRGTSSVLACNLIILVFNGTAELDRDIYGCNTSSFNILFRNQHNLTKNTTYNDLYEIYYDPSGSDPPQPPDEWVNIYLGTSDHFNRDINSSRWTFDNATSGGRSTWVNSSGNGHMRSSGGSDPDDGCFRSANCANCGNNITVPSQDDYATYKAVVMEFMYKRANYPVIPCNSAWGFNDRVCGGSPNTGATGAYFKDNAAGDCQAIDQRSARKGAVAANDTAISTPPVDTWTLMEINVTKVNASLNYSGFRSHANSNSSSSKFITTASSIPLGLTTRALFRLEQTGGASIPFDVDDVKMFYVLESPPTYSTSQENKTVDIARPDVTLNNPPNGTSNTSNNHKFNVNMSDNVELKTATLYHNISGSWQANQTVNVSGTTNSSNFTVANIFPGTYEWNVQVCDTSDLCKQAISNFTFSVRIPIAGVLKVRSCAASTNNFDQGSYDDPCDGNYSIAATCGSNGTINDFLSCDDGNAETHSYNKNRFAGVHIQTFNSSITDCSSIGDVFLCYEWWTSGGDSVNCTIQVDANGNSSYTGLPAGTCPGNTCPFTTPNPGMNCINVTNLENWTCSNFFGNNGTRAVARNLIGKSDIGAETLSTDAFFFNVSYTPT